MLFFFLRLQSRLFALLLTKNLRLCPLLGTLGQIPQLQCLHPRQEARQLHVEL